MCASQVNLLAGSTSLVQVPLAELLLELDADPDEVEELSITAACVQVGAQGRAWPVLVGPMAVSDQCLWCIWVLLSYLLFEDTTGSVQQVLVW